MFGPSNAQSAAPHTALPRTQRRGRRLFLLLVTALSAMSMSSISFAASSQSHPKHATVSPPPRHAPSHQPHSQKDTSNRGAHAGARPAARGTSARVMPGQSKRTDAQHATHRKAVVNARVAAKSKKPKRTHQKPSTLATPATKQPKPVA